MSHPNAFRPWEHLRRPADFDLVYAGRRSASNAFLIVYARPNGLAHARLGLSVSRKFGQATNRNRLRRLYREAFRLTRAAAPSGFDLVLIPRGRETPTLERLMEALPKLAVQAARKWQAESRPTS